MLPDRELYVVLEKLTAPSCKRTDPKQPCQSIRPDAPLVQPIMAERKEDIIKPQLIEEAANWRPKVKDQVGLSGRAAPERLHDCKQRDPFRTAPMSDGRWAATQFETTLVR